MLMNEKKLFNSQNWIVYILFNFVKRMRGCQFNKSSIKKNNTNSLLRYYFKKDLRFWNSIEKKNYYKR